MYLRIARELQSHRKISGKVSEKSGSFEKLVLATLFMQKSADESILEKTSDFRNSEIQTEHVTDDWKHSKYKLYGHIYRTNYKFLAKFINVWNQREKHRKNRSRFNWKNSFDKILN